ncbi:hypothetical protein B5V02_37660 [Mesorhizobium kowhaii]|uniref:Uncharacterized protein n=1 Tax=Mesorhizobium kowhaii TaxID=1300272 RepID=A0A2W7BS00_9HYPH|nr:hypothetical protein B5V02_37660 [Mesorhizobium kowhaii]
MGRLKPAAPVGRVTAQTLLRFNGSPMVVDATLQDIDDQCAQQSAPAVRTAIQIADRMCAE